MATSDCAIYLSINSCRYPSFGEAIGGNDRILLTPVRPWGGTLPRVCNCRNVDAVCADGSRRFVKRSARTALRRGTSRGRAARAKGSLAATASAHRRESGEREEPEPPPRGGGSGWCRQVEPTVSRVLSGAIIHLDAVSPRRSSDLPGDSADHAIVPLFGLAPGGVYLAVECCHRRGALLPHPFTLTGDAGWRRLGGLLSAALAVGSRPPGVTWRPVLWSPDFPRRHRTLARPVPPR